MDFYLYTILADCVDNQKSVNFQVWWPFDFELLCIPMWFYDKLSLAA